MKKLFLVIVFSSMMLPVIAQDVQKEFEQATEEYNEGNYQAAADLYLKIIDSGVKSTEVYYNLGNVYYKMNKVGESIYYYEKALQLSPNDKDIKNNLTFAEQMRIDAIKPLPKTFFRRVHHWLTNLYSIDTWAWISVILVLTSAACFLSYYFSRKVLYKRIFFIIFMMGIVGGIASTSLAYYKYQSLNRDISAILTDKEVNVYGEPNAYSEKSFLLHEGTKVEVLDTLNQWAKIKIADGRTGWVKKSVMKTL